VEKILRICSSRRRSTLRLTPLVEPTQRFFKVSEKIDDHFIQVMPQHTTASYDKDEDKDSCLFSIE
jgi:hypothetical protein